MLILGRFSPLDAIFPAKQDSVWILSLPRQRSIDFDSYVRYSEGTEITGSPVFSKKSAFPLAKSANKILSIS